MGGQLDPAVASARHAVRASLARARPGGRPGELVLVALSGGVDSLALAAAVAFVTPRAGLRWGVVVVDHALQPGSDAVAATAGRLALRLGADPVLVDRVAVDTAAGGGPEAAARTARYDALGRRVTELGAAALLVGHTRDDQAESVLLGLARGSGARSLAGMRSRTDLHRGLPAGVPLLRPFLELSRQQTVAACSAEGLVPWSDPHNDDPAYLRSRVRHQVLPQLERHLGAGVRQSLARSAALLGDDADLLDALAADLFDQVRPPTSESRAVMLAVDGLSAAQPALRRRALRLAALAAGSPPTDLAHTHIDAVDRLLTCWRGQLGPDLPGRVRVRRVAGALHFGVDV